MPEKKTRNYIFRKDEEIPYESGSLMHEEVKVERKARKRLQDGLIRDP